jgi:hypothetical protein
VVAAGAFRLHYGPCAAAGAAATRIGKIVPSAGTRRAMYIYARQDPINLCDPNGDEAAFRPKSERKVPYSEIGEFRVRDADGKYVMRVVASGQDVRLTAMRETPSHSCAGPWKTDPVRQPDRVSYPTEALKPGCVRTNARL